MDDRGTPPARSAWRARLHEVIFEADTGLGKIFDIGLIVCILLSLLVVMLESVASMRAEYGGFLHAIEWVFTILFTIEYGLRIISIDRPWKYVRSGFGIIDLLSFLPTYLSLFFTGTHAMLVIRTLRLFRIFRVLKLARFLGEARVLGRALKSSGYKITVFLIGVFCVIVITGASMYLIEGPENGFTSIPISMYWAVVTMTTVGYGDLTPHTTVGRFAAAILMVLGYGVIAVPTGIVSAELVQSMPRVSTQACPSCSAEGHDADAIHCRWCGAKL